MEFISEYPTASLGRRNIAGLKIVRYFIYVFGMIGPTMLTCLEADNRSIMALINVFVEVLYSANRATNFDIDMSIVLKQKIWIVWYYQRLSSFILPTSTVHESSLRRYNEFGGRNVSVNFLGNYLEHEPPRMQTADFLAKPHGPCIIQR